MKTIIEVFTGDSPVLRRISTAVVVFGILLLCFIWIGLAFKLRFERKIENENMIKETANIACAFEEHTLRTIKSADQAALFLKYEYERFGQAINIPQYISDGRLVDQSFVLLAITDENGDLTASSQMPFVFAQLKDREHFLAHKDVDSGQLFIGKPVFGRSSGKWSIQMTRRINKPDGSFGGVAVVSVDPFYFTGLYRQIDLGRNSSIVLVGRDGTVRARQAGQVADVGRSDNDDVLLEKLSVSDTGYYIADGVVDGIRRVYSYRALRDYPLAVRVGVDEAEALRGFQQRAVGYYLTATLITAIIIFFVILLLHIIAQQKRAEKELKHARDEMEAEVQLRTRELFAANQGLTTMNKDFQKANKELEEEIAERKRVEEALRQKTEVIQYIAYTDALTGLPNRAHLNERLEMEMVNARQGKSEGVVMFIDLDDLKTVNDIYGHTRGDELIIMAGTRIVAEAGRRAFVARIGGDEFIVLIPGENDRQQVAHIADKMIAAFGPEYEMIGERFQMSASIGIVLYPADGDTAEEILKNADNAMYAAKRNGKDCWRFYETAMQREVYEKMLLTNCLRYAIEREELVLHYQPQVAAKDGTVVGFEALLRWNNREHGSIPPACFIPLAEQSGLIQPIGKWVLREACKFARQLTDKGWGHILIAVNISAKQLAADDFLKTVRTVITETGINPDQLDLEITESVLMLSLEEATRKLEELRTIGVVLSLDDFGTGYSSLTYLRNLPVRTLKIDKSFIDIILHNSAQAEIIGTIINIAHILNMIVIAEGVETEQQLAYLTENHCDYIQGYLVSRPLPETEAINFIHKQKHKGD